MQEAEEVPLLLRRREAAVVVGRLRVDLHVADQAGGGVLGQVVEHRFGNHRERLRTADLRSRVRGYARATTSIRTEERHEVCCSCRDRRGAAVPSAIAATPTLNGTVGPGFTITLTKGGAKVTKLAAGTYTIKIADKSNIHNFALKGPGVSKATSVPAKGTFTWKVTLKKGKYTYVCAPHATIMKGSFTVS